MLVHFWQTKQHCLEVKHQNLGKKIKVKLNVMEYKSKCCIFFMSSQTHETPHMMIILFHDSSRGKFLAGFLSRFSNKQQSMQFCFAEETVEKISSSMEIS